LKPVLRELHEADVGLHNDLLGGSGVGETLMYF
jgi:hypothetical protein